MSSSRIYYATHPDATPEVEISALAGVYKFVLDCRDVNRNAAGVTSTNGDDAKGSQHDRASGIIPE